MTVNASPVANGSVQVTPASRAIVTTSSVPTTAGGASDPLDLTGRRPLGGQEARGDARGEDDERFDAAPQAARSRDETGGGEKQHHRERRDDAHLGAADGDGAKVRTVCSCGCCRGRHAVAAPRLDESLREI